MLARDVFVEFVSHVTLCCSPIGISRHTLWPKYVFKKAVSLKYKR